MKKKCHACGFRFQPKKEAIYTAYEPQSLLQSLSSTASRFDVMDCPRCGCQNALAVRLPATAKAKEESEAGEE